MKKFIDPFSFSCLREVTLKPRTVVRPGRRSAPSKESKERERAERWSRLAGSLLAAAKSRRDSERQRGSSW